MTKRKILCLHGTQTSGEVLILLYSHSHYHTEAWFQLTIHKIFKLQMGQLLTRLETEQNLELYFIDGLVETECKEEMKGMFRGPYYSWCSMSPDNKMVDDESAKEALDFVQDVIMEDGPFDGVMG